MHVPCQSGTTAPWARNLWWSKANLQPYIDSTQVTADDGQDDQIASVAILASRARRGCARGCPPLLLVGEGAMLTSAAGRDPGSLAMERPSRSKP